MIRLLAVLFLCLLPLWSGAHSFNEAIAGYDPGPGETLNRPWAPLAWNCTDDYDTPVPPSGPAHDGDQLFDEMDTFAEALDLWANWTAETQTSGSPDGICDAQPWSIYSRPLPAAGNPNELWVGPIYLPSDGVELLVNMTGITSVSRTVEFAVPAPWDPTLAITWWQYESAVNPTLWEGSLGPTPYVTSTSEFDDYRSPIPSGPVYIRVISTGVPATSWLWYLALTPFNVHTYGP